MYHILLPVIFVLCFSFSVCGQQSWRIEGKSVLELRRTQKQVLPLPKVAVPFAALDVDLLLRAPTSRRFRFDAVDFASDAGVLSSAFGLDCVLFGPGSMDHAHRPDEFVPVDELAAARTTLEALVRRRCVDASG